MSKAHFAIAYDGPALRDGTMDVRDLAPALLAVGQLFDAANSIINGDAAQIKVEVRATSRGSFEIDFQLVQTLTRQLVGFLSGDEITAAIHLKELVLGSFLAGSVSLVRLIKKLRGRKPDKLERLDAEHVRITIDGESMIVPLKLLRLYQNLAVRGAAQRAIEEPLKKEGIDEFKIIEENEVIEIVTKNEAEYFLSPEFEEKLILESKHRSAFSIVSLAFKEDRKWRLNDGNNQISAIIDDDDFLRRVDNNQIAFSKGDILVCDVKVTQNQTKGGLRTEYIVERVVEHRPAPRQLPLCIEGEPEGEDGKSDDNSSPDPSSKEKLD